MNKNEGIKAKCPFCNGDGCCNCDHSGFVQYGEGMIFKTKDEAENHDPTISLHDLEKYPQWVEGYKKKNRTHVH